MWFVCGNGDVDEVETAEPKLTVKWRGVGYIDGYRVEGIRKKNGKISKYRHK